MTPTISITAATMDEHISDEHDAVTSKIVVHPLLGLAPVRPVSDVERAVER
jgi:hypothetical protein